MSVLVSLPKRKCAITHLPNFTPSCYVSSYPLISENNFI